MNRSTPGLPVHHQLPEFTQTHVHRVSGAEFLYEGATPLTRGHEGDRQVERPQGLRLFTPRVCSNVVKAADHQPV